MQKADKSGQTSVSPDFRYSFSSSRTSRMKPIPSLSHSPMLCNRGYWMVFGGDESSGVDLIRVRPGLRHFSSFDRGGFDLCRHSDRPTGIQVVCLVSGTPV